MATVIIYPSSDVRLGHTPDNGNVGYNRINETTSDGGSTYIGQTLSTTLSAVTSEFGCLPNNGDNSAPKGKFRIKGVTINVNYEFYSANGYNTSITSRNFNINPSISIDGQNSNCDTPLSSTVNTGDDTYRLNNFSITNLNGVNRTFTSFNDASINVKIETSGNYSTN